ncbi:hypothetical protein PG985_003283 [Apiospora marii]|uniref:uncharacterized protein n=1 Tax=Apiospora marii TaxID=335849 RepID=UPI0031318A7E
MAIVATKAQACITSFDQCLHQAALVHVRERSLVEDQLARFSIWTGTMRVLEPGRQSLDHRLRMAPEVQDTCATLLEVIFRRLQTCTSFALDFYFFENMLSLFPAYLTSTQGKSSLVGLQPQHIDDDTNDDAFQQAICGIAEHISLLNKLSNTIRRTIRELHIAEAANAGAFRICDDEGNGAEGFLKEIFTRYIRDNFPATSEVIQERLGGSMILRRKLMLYRRSRYGTRPIRVQNVPSLAKTRSPSPKPAADTQDTFTSHRNEATQWQDTVTNRNNEELSWQDSISVTGSATTLAPENFRKPSAPSMVSSTKTIALSSDESLACPPAPIGSIKQMQKQIIMMRGKNTCSGEEIDGMSGQYWEHAINAVAEVMCPYCFYVIPASDVADRERWNSHVVKDLDVYICLFEECDSATDMYHHSSQWLEHMRQHIVRWRCVARSHEEFLGNTREEHVEHMKSEHQATLTEAQLDLLAEKAARPMGPLFKSCPLCGILQGSSDAMEAHVAGHLRLLALESLPTYEDGGSKPLEEDGSITGNLGPNNRSTIQSSMAIQLSAEDPALGGTSSAGKRSFARNLFRDQGRVGEQHKRPAEGTTDIQPIEDDARNDNEEDGWDEDDNNDEGEEDKDSYDEDGDMTSAIENSRRAYYGYDQAAGSSRTAAPAYSTNITSEDVDSTRTYGAPDIFEGNEENFLGIDPSNFSVVPSSYYEPGSNLRPILTYERRGCTKPGVQPGVHGIIYSQGRRSELKPGEKDLGYKPVSCTMNPHEILVKESRVNYAKLVTIDHNADVQFIGSITESDFSIVRHAVDDCWRKKNRHSTRHSKSKSKSKSDSSKQLNAESIKLKPSEHEPANVASSRKASRRPH